MTNKQADTKRALVVGLGIAGMSAAIGLHQAGWTPVIVEKASERRTGGYFIGLFEPGQKAATQLGVLNAIHTRTPRPTATYRIEEDGERQRIAGFLDQPEKPEVVLRSDVEAGLWTRIDGQVEVRFNTSPTAITQQADGATVTLKNNATGEIKEETFDLVVGADGVRSTVRLLTFGPHELYMDDWGTIICAFQMEDQVPGFTDQDGLLAYEPRRALWVFPFSDRAPTGLFIYRTDDTNAQFTKPPIEVIRSVFGDMDDPVVKHGLDALAKARNFLFDSVNVVDMPHWVKGRVIVTGDAAWCLTLTSGMGTSAALLGGAELGKAAGEHPNDLEAALRHWESQMRPFIDKQRIPALLKRQAFVPANRFVHWLVSGLMLKGGRKLAEVEHKQASKEWKNAAEHHRNQFG
ncbi:FAD-dependent monooxygenase [Spirosoma oryzicola]|uniref:FAD-dependent monooxygenase n=1 Tax=Spirosoma oryzicola TaxID=2898794 RepID=UPI001E647156|nr:FAD-dependent monooxygenase [Spirosoma oryzicola]UHG94723.1 FAD-dependent monooxygenase [Spirosoma oryzicola]